MTALSVSVRKNSSKRRKNTYISDGTRKKKSRQQSKKGEEIVITIVALRAGKFTLEDYNGLYTTNPKLAFLMTLALFSLAGIPPFAGFFSKFFIFAAAFEGGFHLLVFIALINTIISLYYYLKIVKAMYINKSDEPIAAFRSDNYTRASLAICTLGIVVLSIASVVYQSIDKFSFGL